MIVIIFLFIHQKYKLAQKRKESMNKNGDNNHNNNTKTKRLSFKLFMSEFYSSKSNNGNLDKKFQLSWSLIFSYLLMLSSFITLASSILIMWTDQFSFYIKYYKYESYVIAIGYGISKFCLYILLSFRIEESFINSAYSYNKTFVWFWRIFLFVGIVAFIICYLTNTKIHGTDTHYPQWMALYVVGFDIIACLMNLILFTRQLWNFTQDCKQYTDKISSSQSSRSGPQFVIEFKIIIKKQVLLASLSIFSTILALIVVILFGMPVLCISFDLATTCICVVLMFSWNNKYVMFCCGKCLNKVINDSVIQSIALSKISTGRLSKVPADIKIIDKLERHSHSRSRPYYSHTHPISTSSLTMTMTETTYNSTNSVGSFRNFTNNHGHVQSNNNINQKRYGQKLKMTAPSTSSMHHYHQNEFSSSISIDLSHTKTRNGDEKEIIIPDKIDEEPELSEIDDDDHKMSGASSESNISIGGLSIITPQSVVMDTNITPTPHPTPASYATISWNMRFATNKMNNHSMNLSALDDIEEDIDLEEDDYDEVP